MLSDVRPAPALTVTAATKSFGTVQVLHGVDLEVAPGTIRSIVGHNGSGKSTLVKLLSGYYPLEPGTRVSVDGTPVHLTSHAAAHAAGLRFVHQDLGLVGNLPVVDNLAFGAGYPRHRVGIISWRNARRRCTDMLHELGYNIDVTMPAGALSPGDRTGVALARALQDWGGQARVIVLDEPTAAMSKPEFRHLALAITELTARGLSVIYISHHLEEVLDLGGNVTVLRDGRVVATVATAQLTGADLVTLMVGRELASAPRAAGARPSVDAPPLLELEGLSTRRIRGLDLCIRRCEIVGITGLDGSGREHVAPALAGLLSRGGTVRIGGRPVRARDPRAAVCAGIGASLGDRQTSGVLPSMSAGWNLTVSGVGRYRRWGLLSARTERRDTQKWLARLGVRPQRGDLPVITFSGGNQQKVMLGRWLRTTPTVLVLEEPTQGVDVAAQVDIHEQIRAAAADAAVLLCSSDANELAATCHRVLVMRGGVVAAELVGSEITAERMDSASLWETGAA